MNNKKANGSGSALFAVIFIAIVLIIVISLFNGSGSGSGRYGKGSGKCNICGKTATHTFQGYGYCDTHYENAVNYAINHSK